jgi:hypothetical protein
VFVAFLKILEKHDCITGSHIRRKFCLEKLNHMDFVLDGSAVNEDTEYCLSLLKRIPDPNMRSGTRGWSLPRSQSTHVQSDCESSTGSSSSSAAAHPSPLMGTPGRELSLHLRQQRLQLQLHQGCEGSKGSQPHGLQHCELHMEQRVRGGAI